MAEQIDLLASEILRRVYDKITKNGKNLTLRLSAMAEIASETDGRVEKIGHVCYRSVTYVKIEGRMWLFSFGKKLGGYVAEQYDCDIAAMMVEVNEKISDDGLSKLASYLLSNNEYYSYSFMYALSSGYLNVARDGNYFVPFLNAGIELRDFVTREAMYDTDNGCISISTALPLVRSKTLYKASLVETLVEGFSKVIASYRPDHSYKEMLSHAPKCD
jgi:hypothetical protein